MAIEIRGHKVGMRYTDAKPESFDIVHIRDILLNTVKHECTALDICRIDLFQLTCVIPAACPFAFSVVYLIRYTKVLEGAKQITVDCFTQKHLGGGSPIKVFQDIFAIHTVRSRRKPKQYSRLIVGQKFLIRVCRCMMKFIDNNIVIVICGGPLIQVGRVERLYTYK